MIIQMIIGRATSPTSAQALDLDLLDERLGPSAAQWKDARGAQGALI
jgi:hypothetical protein